MNHSLVGKANYYVVEMDVETGGKDSGGKSNREFDAMGMTPRRWMVGNTPAAIQMVSWTR